MKNSLDNIVQENFQLIIIDFLNIFYRMKWSMRNLKSKSGEETGAIYGILNFVYNLKKRYKKAKIVFVHDRKAEYKRKIDKNYKANRDPKKYENNKEYIYQASLLLSLYGIDQYYAEGFEADDIAGKLVKENKNKRILLISNDNDWFILLSDKVFIMKRNNEIMDRKQVEKKFEIDIDKQNIFKAIVGEKKENVSGISRIPKKIALKLVKKSRKISDVIKIAKLYKFRNKWCKRVFEERERILRNYKLKSLITEGYKLKKFTVKKNNKILLKKLKDYNMDSLHERIKNEK